MTTQLTLHQCNVIVEIDWLWNIHKTQNTVNTAPFNRPLPSPLP